MAVRYREATVAITSPSPYVPAADLVSLQEASDLFWETGHEAAPRTLKRWLTKAGIPCVRRGRDDYASWTELLKLHRQVVDGRLER